MARIRTIKPEFFTSDTVAQCPFGARLLFVGLWTHCDDAGRCRDNAAVLKGALFSMDDDVQQFHIEEWLEFLERRNLIRRYTTDGKRYLSVTNWSEHQKISHPSPSRLPEPPDQAQEDSGAAPESSGEPLERLRPDLGPRNRDLGTTPLPPTNGTVVDLPKPRGAGLSASERVSFEAFYAEYPRKKQRGDAERAWKKALKATTPEHIMATLQAIKPEWAKRDLDKVPYPASWLNGGGWDDQPDTPVVVADRRERLLCSKCDEYAIRGSGRCAGRGQQSVASIRETAALVDKPEIEICRGWEYIQDAEGPGVRGIPRVDDRGCPGQGVVVDVPPDVPGDRHERGDRVLPPGVARRMGEAQLHVVGGLVTEPRPRGPLPRPPRADARLHPREAR